MEVEDRQRTYARLAPKVRKYVWGKFGSLNFEDRCQDALIRLWRQLGKFNPRRGASLDTWAITVAHNAVLRSIENERWYNPVETTEYKTLKRILEFVKGDPEAEAKIREALEREVQKSKLTSLDAPLGADEDQELLVDLIPATGEDNPFQGPLNEIINTLPPDQQLVIVLYDLAGLSMEQVKLIDGTAKNLSTLWARRKAGLEQLKKKLYEQAGVKEIPEGEPDRRTVKEVLAMLRGS